MDLYFRVGGDRGVKKDCDVKTNIMTLSQQKWDLKKSGYRNSVVRYKTSTGLEEGHRDFPDQVLSPRIGSTKTGISYKHFHILDKLTMLTPLLTTISISGPNDDL